MAINKKLLEVDFFFDPKPLTTNEKERISDFIKLDKERKSHSMKSRESKKRKQLL